MSNTLKQEYQKVSDKIDLISSRERLLVLFCGLVVIIFLCHSLLVAPMHQKNLDAATDIRRTEASLITQTKELSEITTKLRLDPNIEVNKKIAILNEQIISVDRQITDHTQHLVPANKMASLLENLLVETKSLKLIELKSIAPILVLTDAEANDDKPNDAIYRHGVALIFEGSYFDIQGYLEKLETLEWKFHWKKFDYVVSEYPTAIVELEMYTLSTNKAFIGV